MMGLDTLKLNTYDGCNIWFFSDPHYNHIQMIRDLSKFEDKSRLRDFPSLEAHDSTLVNNINNNVKETDVLICLGDWSFGSYKDDYNINKIFEFREKIQCKTLHLVLGNHDRDIRKNTKNCQSLFTSVNHYLEVEIKELKHNEKSTKQDIILSHYAHRVWNKSHRGSWMLYGHSHGSLDEMKPEFTSPTWIGDDYFIKNFKTMDVGIDTHPEFRPYSYKEIKDIMDKKEILLNVDHH